jgi:prepilin-type N-terminal cleavage/methylation domain-containing protein
MEKTNQQSGFTLIEVVIYLALFGIMFSGAVVASYSILESSGKNQTRAMMQEEGEFLLAKINWAVSNAQTATVPEGGRLVTDTVEFDQDGNSLVLKRNTDPGVELNNSAVSVKNLSFVDISATSNGVKGISYKFDLESNSPNGAILTSNFASTAYLRK